MSSEARDASGAPGASRDGAPVVAVIAAAGGGTRFGAALPKQYAELDGLTLLERSVRAMLDVDEVVAVVVALAPDDTRFARLGVAADARVHAVSGAASRAGSVAAALARVRALHGDDAWALVHDAARPLVAGADVRRLLASVREVPASGSGHARRAGGILAVRVVDTLKRERRRDPGHIDATVPRDGLWQAQTPQLFRAGELSTALEAAAAADGGVTDEASAMERTGARCLLVEAHHPNPKITFPADMAVARALLMQARDAANPETPTCA